MDEKIKELLEKKRLERVGIPAATSGTSPENVQVQDANNINYLLSQENVKQTAAKKYPKPFGFRPTPENRAFLQTLKNKSLINFLLAATKFYMEQKPNDTTM